MCFYFGLPEALTVIKKRFKSEVKNPELFVPTEKYNGFAHPACLLLTNEEPKEFTSGEWGLMPSWSKELTFRKNTLNARIETVETLPSFKNSVRHRCLVPASCFYEWRLEGKKKIPYQLVSGEHPDAIFAMAGLYNDWRNPQTGAFQRTFTLLTTEANDTMRYIHNTKQRMPVILHEADEAAWLHGAPIASFAFPYSCNLIAFEK